MNLETVVLGFLNEEPMSGYELSKKIDGSVGFFWHATHPQIYTTLNKLESDGCVQFDHQVPETGPARKIYSLTPEGKDLLFSRLSEKIEASEVKFPLLVSMFHGSELGREHWIGVLKSQLAEQKAKLNIYRQIREELLPQVSSVDLNPYLKLRTVEFGIGYQEFFLKWLRETLREIEP